MYGLIGKPLGHSFSANFFNKKFTDENIPERYILFPLDSITELPSLLRNHPDLKGLNVTIPYKQTVIPYLDSLDKAAAEIGAVNVIKISKDNSLKGYNSDAVGFKDSIEPLIHDHMKRALVLGTGGASKAVCYVLKMLGIEVLSVSRNSHDEVISYNDLSPEIISSHHIIVNTTPLGMWPNVDQAPDIPYHLLTPQHLCYDLVYNPETTTFMKRCAQNGATVKNGLDMLHGQALAAWRIWNECE